MSVNDARERLEPIEVNDPPRKPASDETEAPRSGKGRVRRTLSGWRQLGRIAYRDPEHVAERLTLYSARNLGEPSLEWAQAAREARPDVPRAVIAEELRTQTAQVARIDGAVSGTPFLIALIPGYLSYLREEGRMVLRTAALYGRDPRELETSAEALVLRGAHPTVDVAREALETCATFRCRRSRSNVGRCAPGSTALPCC